MHRHEGYERARRMLIAAGKLKKTDKLYYRENEKRPRMETERVAIQQQHSATVERRQDIDNAMSARSHEVLSRDPLYQALKAERARLKEDREKLAALLGYRIELCTYTNLGGLMVEHCEASGCNWQHLIDRLTARLEAKTT